MSPIEIVGAVLLMVSSVLIIIIVMMQESKQAGMGAITGEASNNFYERNSGRTKEAFMSKLTKILAVIFFAVTLALNLIIHFVG